MKSIIIQFLETGEQSIFNYATNQIFLILGYVLAADLCFKLVRTFSDIGCSKQETKKVECNSKLRVAHAIT